MIAEPLTKGHRDAADFHAIGRARERHGVGLTRRDLDDFAAWAESGDPRAVPVDLPAVGPDLYAFRFEGRWLLAGWNPALRRVVTFFPPDYLAPATRRLRGFEARADAAARPAPWSTIVSRPAPGELPRTVLEWRAEHCPWEGPDVASLDARGLRAERDRLRGLLGRAKRRHRRGIEDRLADVLARLRPLSPPPAGNPPGTKHLRTVVIYVHPAWNYVWPREPKGGAR